MTRPRLAAGRKRQLDALAAASQACADVLVALDLTMAQVTAGGVPDLAALKGRVAVMREKVNAIPAAFGAASKPPAPPAPDVDESMITSIERGDPA